MRFIQPRFFGNFIIEYAVSGGGLAGVYIKSGANPLLPHGLLKRGMIDHFSSGRVDKTGARPYGFEEIGIDQARVSPVLTSIRDNDKIRLIWSCGGRHATL